MSAKVLILNGPNLNMLGTREPDIYGRETLADIEDLCRESARALDLDVECLQSNYEGELVSVIQQASDKYAGIIINPAAYGHTSVALLDALKLCALPVIEVHLSNIYARESFRHNSLIAPIVKGSLCGFGALGYSLALHAIKEELDRLDGKR